MFGVLATLKQGGLTMLPLGICSFLAVAIIIERCIALRRPVVIDPRLLRLLRDYAGEASVDQALALCRRVSGPFGRILEEVIRARHLEHAQLLETLRSTGRTQVGTLERGLTILEIIAGVSPLLGLLGTVLGMRTVFNAITTEGIGNAQVLSDGISKALITTIAGLFIAIPALGFHSWFSRRVEAFAIEMEDYATGFIAKLEAMRRKP